MELGVSKIMFTILGTLLLAGVIGSFWYQNQVDIISQPPTTGVEVSNSVKPACVVTGCSSEVCSDQEVMTTCVYKEEYVCYEYAKCERQPGGDCGWTKTDEYSECLSGLTQ